MIPRFRYINLIDFGDLSDLIDPRDPMYTFNNNYISGIYQISGDHNS